MSQLTLSATSKTAIAIERIRFNAPRNGPLWIAQSYGKDSAVMQELVRLSGVPFESHHNVVGVEPPELIKFGRMNYPDTHWDMPERSMFDLVVSNGLPTRMHRWCCRELKERGGAGRTVVTGVRAQESNKRRHRGVYETCFRDDTRHFLNPIVDWTTKDVWAFIEERQLPVCELYHQGFKRLGCILCPNNGRIATRKHLAMWPKIAEAWKRAGIRSWERRTVGMKAWATGEDYWQWWLTRTRQPLTNEYPTLFTM